MNTLILENVQEPWPYLGTPAERAGFFRKVLLSAAPHYSEKGLPVFPALLIGGQLWPARPELVGDAAPGLACLLAVGLVEDLPDHRPWNRNELVDWLRKGGF